MKDRLYVFRGRKVMLDTDLAEIYGYETKKFLDYVASGGEQQEGIIRKVERYLPFLCSFLSSSIRNIKD